MKKLLFTINYLLHKVIDIDCWYDDYNINRIIIICWVIIIAIVFITIDISISHHIYFHYHHHTKGFKLAQNNLGVCYKNGLGEWNKIQMIVSEDNNINLYITTIVLFPIIIILLVIINIIIIVIITESSSKQSSSHHK